MLQSVRTRCISWVNRVGLALLGELDHARAAVQAGLALDPGFTIRRFRAGTATYDPTYLAGRERNYHGLRMAGVQKFEQQPTAMSDLRSNARQVRFGSFASIQPHPSMSGSRVIPDVNALKQALGHRALTLKRDPYPRNRRIPTPTALKSRDDVLKTGDVALFSHQGV